MHFHPSDTVSGRMNVILGLSAEQREILQPDATPVGLANARFPSP